MDSLPIYRSPFGDKHTVFDCLKIYLSNFKKVYDIKKCLMEKTYDELKELEKKINNSFKEDYNTIVKLQKEHDDIQSKWRELYQQVNSLDIALQLDLIKLFID